jgi:hypothetical protein
MRMLSQLPPFCGSMRHSWLELEADHCLCFPEVLEKPSLERSKGIPKLYDVWILRSPTQENDDKGSFLEIFMSLSCWRSWQLIWERIEPWRHKYALPLQPIFLLFTFWSLSYIHIPPFQLLLSTFSWARNTDWIITSDQVCEFSRMVSTEDLRAEKLFSVKDFVCVVTGGATGIGLMWVHGPNYRAMLTFQGHASSSSKWSPGVYHWPTHGSSGERCKNTFPRWRRRNHPVCFPFLE